MKEGEGEGEGFFQEWHQQEKSFLSLSICLFSLFHRFHSLFFSFHESVLAEINIYIYEPVQKQIRIKVKSMRVRKQNSLCVHTNKHANMK